MESGLKSILPMPEIVLAIRSLLLTMRRDARRQMQCSWTMTAQDAVNASLGNGAMHFYPAL